MKPELFDYGIGEDFARDPFYFSMSGGCVERIGEPDDKILSLPDVLDPLILHLSKRIVNGLTLRVEHCLLQRDIDMSLHFA
jgi:hypothetical protein